MMNHVDSVAAPGALRRQVRRAARLTYCLGRLCDRLDPADAGYAWALDREKDVRNFAGRAVREWIEGRLEAGRAADRIGSYVQPVEESLLAYARAARRSSATY
jgi:hypothetical protein